MSHRLKCPSCHASFLVREHPAGRSVRCPKCESRFQGPVESTQTATSPPKLETEPPRESVFVPTTRSERRKGLSLRWIGLLVILTIASVAVLVTWPQLKAWWKPRPLDPVETVAARFLEAISSEDSDGMNVSSVSTVEEPPVIQSFRDVTHLAEFDHEVRGPFRPIAGFHRKINESYDYMKDVGRFQPKNLLGTAAETLDVLHEAKDQQADLSKQIASGSPDDLFNAAESMASSFNKLAEGALAPERILPTYEQLVEQAKPALEGSAKELALEFGRDTETWDRLLKRPFLTLKSDGPFVLDQAEVSAQVRDRLASAGAPPSTLRLKLMRFRLEGIDTHWKVVEAVREEPGAAASEKTSGKPLEAQPKNTYESESSKYQSDK